MRLKQIRDDTRGAALVEATITMPIFLLLTFGIVQCGLLLWTQLGLQYAVDMAARCTSVNDAANNTSYPTSFCFSAPLPTPIDKSKIQSYAANNAWGIHPPASVFNVDLATDPTHTVCSAGIPGNKVSVTNYNFDLINYIFSVNLSATACYPTTLG
jgi:hypothetical protein